jgi:hypothetical protein
MDESAAKADLLHQLARSREALVWKLDGLSEYDVRRPLVPSGTNLLGLVKHVATWEAWYFGEIVGRPFPGPLPRWEDDDGSDLWVRADESRADVLAFAARAARHTEETVAALPLDAPGHVPWWSRPDVTLLGLLVHVIGDVTRHAGHADILREQLDGRTGVGPGRAEPVDEAARAARWEQVEAAARVAQDTPSGPPPGSEPGARGGGGE